MPAIHHPGRGIGRHYRRKRSHDSTPPEVSSVGLARASCSLVASAP
jgi:hypothetical protein